MKWLVAAGSSVISDDPLCGVETDNVETENPSPLSGAVVEVLGNIAAELLKGEHLARIDRTSQSEALLDRPGA